MVKRGLARHYEHVTLGKNTKARVGASRRQKPTEWRPRGRPSPPVASPLAATLTAVPIEHHGEVVFVNGDLPRAGTFALHDPVPRGGLGRAGDIEVVAPPEPASGGPASRAVPSRFVGARDAMTGFGKHQAQASP